MCTYICIHVHVHVYCIKYKNYLRSFKKKKKKKLDIGYWIYFLIYYIDSLWWCLRYDYTKVRSWHHGYAYTYYHVFAVKVNISLRRRFLHWSVTRSTASFLFLSFWEKNEREKLFFIWKKKDLEWPSSFILQLPECWYQRSSSFYNYPQLSPPPSIMVPHPTPKLLSLRWSGSAKQS